MRVAYADPPYIGCAHYYPENEEVDHERLILELEQSFPDGWALSLHTPSLKQILELCHQEIRVMAWVKPFASYKPGVGVAYAWEPVIVHGGRKRTREQSTVRDWVSANITLQKGLVGAKPEAFAYWLFDVFNLQPQDEFVDMFPGTGIMTHCWNEFRTRKDASQLELFKKMEV